MTFRQALKGLPDASEVTLRKNKEFKAAVL
jgi:hypothetical protein